MANTELTGLSIIPLSLQRPVSTGLFNCPILGYHATSIIRLTKGSVFSIDIFT